MNIMLFSIPTPSFLNYNTINKQIFLKKKRYFLNTIINLLVEFPNSYLSVTCLTYVNNVDIHFGYSQVPKIKIIIFLNTYPV